MRWVWRGQLRHNVTVVRGPVRFRSRTKRSGSFARKLRRRGRYRLICTIHGGRRQSMRIRVRRTAPEPSAAGPGHIHATATKEDHGCPYPDVTASLPLFYPLQP
jgi:hypothetical protein